MYIIKVIVPMPKRDGHICVRFYLSIETKFAHLFYVLSQIRTKMCEFERSEVTYLILSKSMKNHTINYKIQLPIIRNVMLSTVLTS